MAAPTRLSFSGRLLGMTKTLPMLSELLTLVVMPATDTHMAAEAPTGLSWPHNGPLNLRCVGCRFVRSCEYFCPMCGLGTAP